MRPISRRFAFVLCSIALCGCGCFAFGNYQSPRPVDPGHPKFLIATSRNNLQEPGDDFAGWTVVEVMARAPIARIADWGMRGTFVVPDGGGLGGELGVDFKLAPLPDYLAFDLPVSILMASAETVHISPGIIAGIPVNDHFELTAAGKFIVFDNQETPMYAYNVGFAYFPRDRRGYGFRPEVGWLHWEEGDSAIQLGIAIELPAAASKPTRTPVR